MATFWALFLNTFYAITKISTFKEWFVLDILRFRKWFYVNAYYYYFQFDLFGWVNALATFSKSWASFYPIILA
jgi:hypothetical protein